MANQQHAGHSPALSRLLAQQRLGAEAGQLGAVAAEMSLVGIAGEVGERSEVAASRVGARELQEAAEPKDTLQGLGTVAHRDAAATQQLAGAQSQLGGEGVNSQQTPIRICKAAYGGPKGEIGPAPGGQVGSRGRDPAHGHVDGHRTSQLFVQRRQQIGDVDPAVAQLVERNAER